MSERLKMWPVAELWAMWYQLTQSRRSTMWHSINQSCLCSGAPIKILNMETQVNLPSFQYFVCIVAHCHWETTIFWLHGVRTWETTSLEPSWTSPYDLVSFVGFNLYLFPVINSNCECNSFPWVLWVHVTNYQNWSWFWNPRKLYLLSAVRMVFYRNVSSNVTVWLLWRRP